MRPSYFDKLWSNRKSLPPQWLKGRQTDRQTVAKAPQPYVHNPDTPANIAAAQRRRREWERYLDIRRHRLVSLSKDYPAVARYRATLKALLKDREAKWTGVRDCNVGLAELCEELSLREVCREYDRFLLVELTNSFISALGKRDGVSVERLVDDPIPLPLLAPPDPTEMDRVKAVLNVR